MRSLSCMPAALVVAMLCCTRTLGAQPSYVQQQGGARLTVEDASTRMDGVEIALSATLHLVLSVEGPATLEVQLPESIVSLPAWEVRQPMAAPVRIDLGGGRVRWQQEILIEPLQPGDGALTPAPLRYRDGPKVSTWQNATWEPVPVRVTTEISGTDLKQLRDIPPPLAPPAESAGSWWLLWVGLAALLAVLLAGWRATRRPPAKDVPLTAPEWARRELDRLEALSLPARGESARYYTLLADAVREYLERRLQLHAPRQTTAEFLQALQAVKQLTPEQQEALRVFFERCDLAKFAGLSPSVEECRDAATLARSFVEQTSGPADPPANPG